MDEPTNNPPPPPPPPNLTHLPSEVYVYRDDPTKPEEDYLVVEEQRSKAAGKELGTMRMVGRYQLVEKFWVRTEAREVPAGM